MKLFSVLQLTTLLICAGIITKAQETDTIRLSLPAAEKRFVDSNFTLLAARYNIDIAKAEEITAGLYLNPELNFENILYNPDNRKIYDLGYNGSNTAELSQVIRLAGKRNKSVRLAESGTRLSEYEFFDLVRTLSFSLKDNYYKLYFYRHSWNLYEVQISSLRKMLVAFKDQLAKGNIAAKDVLRIQSLIINLQSEQTALREDINTASSELRILLRVPANANLAPEFDHSMNKSLPLGNITYNQLLDSARISRYDLIRAKENIHYQQLNLQLQKALAVPDLTVGLTYDKQGNFTRNYNGLALSMPLPFFNRNQGNIKQAKSQIAQSEVEYHQTEDLLTQQVRLQYDNALQAEKLYSDIDPDFDAQFNKLIEEVQRNFMKRNISLLEFIDFYDSYKETITRLDQIRYRRYLALETLNYTVGKNIIQY